MNNLNIKLLSDNATTPKEFKYESDRSGYGSTGE